ncbi:TlyA family RNA methyltransferase [Sneathiella marina]|uniref:TlyA family RNA methyltransferase n=1 Tax=Sneathiella marina TaxID=2950108 RepID=A0ABY4W6D6_9PROT|nr:TlyA family RNA methyltransferase [Sneathiella marina]USG62730.1 TlyA family RNA methyltransferase [Sneathiella marina]
MPDFSAPTQRLDLELVRRKMVKSRARAQDHIKNGHVFVDDVPTTKMTRKVSQDIPITINAPEMDWVGRGALKLLAALEYFEINPAGSIAADIGASTGGFCQVLLQHDAQKIYAVDVGHGQLDPLIANDKRVINLEKTNARILSSALIADPLDLVVSDVSFISLKLALPPALKLCRNGAHLLALVKPQFEVGKGNVGKGGIVRDPELVRSVPLEMTNWINSLAGWQALGTVESPIEGSDGNTEFLLGAKYAP